MTGCEIAQPILASGCRTRRLDPARSDWLPAAHPVEVGRHYYEGAFQVAFGKVWEAGDDGCEIDVKVALWTPVDRVSDVLGERSWRLVHCRLAPLGLVMGRGTPLTLDRFAAVDHHRMPILAVHQSHCGRMVSLAYLLYPWAAFFCTILDYLTHRRRPCGQRSRNGGAAIFPIPVR
jgi:hypothetical protein